MGIIKDIFKRIFGVKRVGAKRPESTFRGECEICFKKIDVGQAFSCKYCGEWHCSDHILPEDHQCSGNPTNPHIR